MTALRGAHNFCLLNRFRAALFRSGSEAIRTRCHNGSHRSPEVTEARRGEGRPQDPGSRDAVVGVRELGNPLQGVRPARGPPQSFRKAGRRGEGARVHGGRAHRGDAHPLGPGRGLRGAREARRGARADPRRDQLQHLPGRRLQAGQRLPPGRRGAQEGRGPSAGMRRHHGRHGFEGPEAVVRGRYELSRPGRPPGPPGPPLRGPRPGVRASRRRPADAP